MNMKKKNPLLTIRVSEGRREFFKKVAGMQGLSMTGWILSLLNKEAEKISGKKFLEEDQDILQQAA